MKNATRMAQGAGRSLALLLTLLSSLISHPSSHAEDRKPISVGEPDADTSPAGEMKTFQLLDGFEVNLFASEEDGVPNPLIIRWDERGRLWCVCPLSYPQPVPGEPLKDKIIILEDTDHDGHVDKTTVFADGLSMPTGLELAPAKSPKGHSVYVGMGEKLLLMHDLDGDDKVDETETVLSGFGTGDTHQNINSFIWSPDGTLILHQGLHCYSRVTTAWGVKELYGAGFWHYRPLSGKLEPYPTGMPLNPWGTAFTNDGQPIMVAGAAGMYWARPMEVNTSRTTASQDPAVRKDKQVAHLKHFLLERFQLPYGGQSIKTDGLTKFCGIDIVGNTHWPEAMQGEVITGGFFNNKIFRFTVRDDPEFPSGLETVEQPALLTSDSVAFRPVDVRFGPEGALYVADWYDPIIGHYQASFRHPNRDKAHGRIWRITAKGRELSHPPKLDPSNPSSLGRTWENHNRWSAYQAARLLASHDVDEALNATGANWDKKPFPPLPDNLTKDNSAPSVGDERWKLRLQKAVVGLAESQTLKMVKAGEWSDAFDPAILALLSRSLDANIRAYATHSLGTFADSIPNVLKLIEAQIADDSPRVRLEAVVAAAKVNSPDAIKVALKVLDKPMDSYIERALWLAVHATKAQWYPASQSPASLASFQSFLASLAPTHIAFLIKREGSRQLLELTSTLLKQTDLPATVREGLTLALAKDAPADGLSAEERQQLTPIAKDAAKLAALAQRDSASLKLRAAALNKLVAADAAQAGQLVAARLNAFTELDAMREWLAPVLPVETANKAFLAALKAKPCSVDAAKLTMRVLTSTGRSEPDLMSLVTGIIGASSPVPAYSPEFVNTLAAEVKAKGNAAKGKAVFQSTIVNCTACHSIAKQGGTIGPELDAVGRGVPIELLIEAVAWPNRQIKEGYIATLVKTKDGRMLQGYKVGEANGELQLRDLLTKSVSKFTAAEIESRTDSGSLMPEGLLGLMTREELRDLIAFLTTLGR